MHSFISMSFFSQLNINFEQLPYYLYYMPKKSCPILHSKLSYKMGHDFLDRQYAFPVASLYFKYSILQWHIECLFLLEILRKNTAAVKCLRSTYSIYSCLFDGKKS